MQIKSKLQYSLPSKTKTNEILINWKTQVGNTKIFLCGRYWISGGPGIVRSVISKYKKWLTWKDTMGK